MAKIDAPKAFIPPGPRGHFLLGHLQEYGKDPLGFLARCARDYGDIVHLRFPGTHVYLLNHPDYIEEVLSADSADYIRHKGMRLRLTRRLLGNGLLTSEGDFSRSQRRLALPAFHRTRVAAYGALMLACTERMLATWRAGQTRNVHKDMMRLTLEIVSKTLFDADVTRTPGDIAEAALGILKDEFTARRSSLRSLSVILALPVNRRARKAVRQLDGIIHRIIQHRQASAEDTGDLLSMLLAARDETGDRLSEQQLRDEVITFFFAGHEATGLTLSWAWYLLAQHPRVEEKLVAELRAVLGGRAPSAADLPSLRYTAMVVKEALRLYPPAWAIGRESLRDRVVGGYDVPAGTQLIMSQWVTHRDPRYFECPEDFRPERWTDDSIKQLPRYAYFPYGGGARVCIGNAFAEMEMVLLLATIAQRFRLTLVTDQQVAPLPTFALVPKDGIRVVVTERQ
ncbi:MAG TPA: cytochrome P450 [Pyrinomonadaceae bacterium]|nr:cytochrome P450 [Pyrinomonadaceae bacterium]